MNLLPFNLEKALNGAKVVHEKTPEMVGEFYKRANGRQYLFVYNDLYVIILEEHECYDNLRLLEETEETEERWAWMRPS